MTALPKTPAILVFTDLDGTLLDHNTYDWSPARPAFNRLRSIGAGLVLASSKTGAELVRLREEMGWEVWPAIVENGAGILEPGDLPATTGNDYARLRATLDALPVALSQHYRGFFDMGVDEVRRTTGLSSKGARLAKARAFSEPGVWTGDEDTRDAFLAALKAQGVSARMGGRFLTLSFGATKADAMATVMERFAPAKSIALGDAPNDIEMLEAADLGIIVPNPDAAPLPALAGEAAGTIRRAPKPGPEGWTLSVTQATDDLDIFSRT